MSNGHAAGFAVVIEQEKVEEMKLPSYESFLGKLKQRNVSLDEFARSTNNSDVIYTEDDEELGEKETKVLDAAYKAFMEEFNEVTGVGVEIAYHSSEDGDCYDEIDGVYFPLDFGDIYELTPAAKKLKETSGFDWKSFVVYG